MVYKCTTLLLHVSAYNDYFHAGGYQRTEWLCIIIGVLKICIYKAKINVLKNVHSKMYHGTDYLYPHVL
jgi:heme exporter protein D